MQRRKEHGLHMGDGHEFWVMAGLRRVVLLVSFGLLSCLGNGWRLAGTIGMLWLVLQASCYIQHASLGMYSW